METVETKTTTTAPPAVVTQTVKEEIKPPVKTEHPQVVYEKKKTIYRAHQVIWFLLVAVEILLGFRMTLKALGANPLSPFTTFIYALSDPLALPFSGILGTNISGNQVFEWSTLVAAIVYLIIAVGIVHIMQFFKPVTPEEVETHVDPA